MINAFPESLYLLYYHEKKFKTIQLLGRRIKTLNLPIQGNIFQIFDTIQNNDDDFLTLQFTTKRNVWIVNFRKNLHNSVNFVQQSKTKLKQKINVALLYCTNSKAHSTHNIFYRNYIANFSLEIRITYKLYQITGRKF